MRARVVAAVEERLQTGVMQEPCRRGRRDGRSMYGSWYKGEGWGDRRRLRRGRWEMDTE